MTPIAPIRKLFIKMVIGIVIRKTVARFQKAATKAWMESGAFKKNPIGVEFDPEKLVERYLQGDPIEELIEQGSA